MTVHKRDLNKFLSNPDFEIGHFSGHQLVTPTETTLITKEMAKSGFWHGNQKLYAERSLPNRGCGAILNSSVTQMRLVIGVSRNVLGRLLANDPNIPTRKSPSINSDEYNAILSELQSNYAKKIRSSTSKTEGFGEMAIYEITDPAIREIVSKVLGRPIEQIIDEQLREVIEFVEQGRRAATRKQALKNFENWYKKYESRGVLKNLQPDEGVASSQLDKIVTDFFKAVNGDEQQLELFITEVKGVQADYINETADVSLMIRRLWKNAHYTQAD